MNIGETRLGTRVRGKEPHTLTFGEYMLDTDAAVDYHHEPEMLWLQPPGARHLMRVSARIHGITVNPDDTITVTPSIICRHGDGSSCWHGFLQSGVWTRVP